MTGSGTPSPSSPPDGDADLKISRRPVGQLAVVAFICGLAGICPGVGLLGMILGFIANFQIVRSGGRLRGRGFALWGLGLGAASTFLWMSGFSAFSTVYFGVVSARMEADVRDLLLAAAVEDVSGVEGLIDRSCTFEESEIDRFMAEVRSAGLTPWSVGISDPLEVSGVVEQVMTVDVTIHAEDRSVWSGTAGFLLVPPALLMSLDIEGLAPDPRLRNLRLIGPGGRSLRLSGQSVDPETQAVESPASTTPLIPEGGSAPDAEPNP